MTANDAEMYDRRIQAQIEAAVAELKATIAKLESDNNETGGEVEEQK